MNIHTEIAFLFSKNDNYERYISILGNDFLNVLFFSLNTDTVSLLVVE